MLTQDSNLGVLDSSRIPWIQKDIDSIVFSIAYLAELQFSYLEKK